MPEVKLWWYRWGAAALVAVAAAAVQMPAQAREREVAGAQVWGGQRVAPPAPVRRGQWWDGAHGHGHAYPVAGWRVHTLPSHARFVVWGGVRYGYWDGVWYAPYSGAYVVARPPVGVIVSDLPVFRTVVTIGGLTYLYANGVYYRERPDGYEVVPSPIVAGGDTGTTRSFVYPAMNQSAEKQASDEYECHRWAVDQTGFDPTSAATGQGAAGGGSRADYTRAQRACLEGRGYTVR